MNMSDQEAMDLMTRSRFINATEAEGKLQRAKLSSTQLPTYYVGIREWFRTAQKISGGGQGEFQPAWKFHDLVLDEGPLPAQ